ncbi:MAG: N-methyl-L-tryptophan oxidase [Frankiales bacterium]|nr:N-methyl-L-tryptophan oxidase [Frankiales bacterium]
MGSSAAYHLARRGQRVLGLEQFTPAHDRGSSHGGTRIVRQAYFERPDYVPLLRRSYELWDELSVQSGRELFVRCGALMIGRPDSAVVAGTVKSAQQWDLPVETLDRAAMRARYPQFSLPEDHIAVLEANAGYALAEPSVLANLELASDAGAELWFETAMESIELGPDGVRIQAGGLEVIAAKVVLATGAWASTSLALELAPIGVLRQTVHWYEPAGGQAALVDFDPQRFPVYLWEWPGEEGARPTEIYGFPRVSGDPGVKAGIYRDGSPAHPDQLDRVVTDADAANLERYLAKALPGLLGPRLRGSACMYAGVPDDDFVIGFHPRSGARVVLAVGFSGHGFKFMPVVGEIVADLVIDGETIHDIDFLAPDRPS